MSGDEVAVSPRDWPEVGAVLPPDQLSEKDYQDDDGTMPGVVQELAEAVVGRRIVSAEVASRKRERSYLQKTGLRLTLDNGTQVWLHDTSDCCAFTELKDFFLDPNSYDHVITGVKTADGYTRWFIFAELTDVLKLSVAWSAGNPFYYGYGFEIAVVPLVLEGEVIAEDQRELE